MNKTQQAMQEVAEKISEVKRLERAAVDGLKVLLDRMTKQRLEQINAASEDAL